jgi:hypothetical protein
MVYFKRILVIGLGVLLPLALLGILYWRMIPEKADVITGDVVFNAEQGVWGMQVKDGVLPGTIFQVNNLPTEFQREGVNITCAYEKLDVLGSSVEWDVIVDVSNCLNNNTGETVVVEAPGTMRTVNFSGTVDKVDMGCFADGECFVETDGKYITILIGGSREPVGFLEGIENFNDLENQVGRKAEVYAQDKGDGTYTLYGSEQFYIKLQ